MIVIFETKQVAEIRDWDDLEDILDIYLTRHGYTECSIINTANKEVGHVKNGTINWTLWPDTGNKYSLIGKDGTVLCTRLEVIDALRHIVEFPS